MNAAGREPLHEPRALSSLFCPASKEMHFSLSKEPPGSVGIQYLRKKWAQILCGHTVSLESRRDLCKAIAMPRIQKAQS